MPMTAIANARMYSVTPAATMAWRSLLARVLARAALDFTIIDHAAPAPMAALWERDDLGCVLMCGLPFAKSLRERRTLRAVAAPVPSPPAFQGQPVYWTDIVVRADSAFATPRDLAGARFGYTALDSQSGFWALRAWLEANLGIELDPPFDPSLDSSLDPSFDRAIGRVDDRRHQSSLESDRSRIVFETTTTATLHGPLITPRRVIEAVVAGEIDAGPVDAYALALLSAHEGALTENLRTLARTRRTPLPLFVAGTQVTDAQLAALQRALLSLADDPAAAPTLRDLLLRGFAIPAAADYDELPAKAVMDATS